MPPKHFFLSCSPPSFPFPQYRPLFLGSGLLHFRCRYCMQSALHGVQVPHEDHPPSTVSHTLEQCSFWMGSPSQPGPLLMGAGLLQSLVRLRVPRPHFLLHSDHSDQSPHLPGTEKWRRNFKNFVRFLSTCEA